jgi:hypothetical protein
MRHSYLTLGGMNKIELIIGSSSVLLVRYWEVTYLSYCLPILIYNWCSNPEISRLPWKVNHFGCILTCYFCHFTEIE